MEHWVLVIKDTKDSAGRRRRACREDLRSGRTFLRVVPCDRAGEEAVRQPYEVIVVAGGSNRIALLSALQSSQPYAQFVLVTHDRDWREARDAMRAGADDILAEPLRRRDLLGAVKRLLL